MVTTLQLGEMKVDVVLKDIKNVHLSVYPPLGRVRIAAPTRMKMETIRLYAISKLGWIKQQQKLLLAQEREAPREFIERESHYVWGKRYLLKVREHDAPPTIELKHRVMVLTVRSAKDRDRSLKIVDDWYREQLKIKIMELIAKWEPILSVRVEGYYVQRMKTKWGSCNATARTIRINSELAKKPLECLEYLVVHEMIHIIEPTHNAHFHVLMNRFMPNWKQCRQALNRLPVRHEDWQY